MNFHRHPELPLWVLHTIAVSEGHEGRGIITIDTIRNRVGTTSVEMLRTHAEQRRHV